MRVDWSSCRGGSAWRRRRWRWWRSRCRSQSRRSERRRGGRDQIETYCEVAQLGNLGGAVGVGHKGRCIDFRIVTVNARKPNWRMNLRIWLVYEGDVVDACEWKIDEERSQVLSKKLRKDISRNSPIRKRHVEIKIDRPIDRCWFPEAPREQRVWGRLSSNV